MDDDRTDVLASGKKDDGKDKKHLKDILPKKITTEVLKRSDTTDVLIRPGKTDILKRHDTTDVPNKSETTDVLSKSETTDVLNKSETTDVLSKSETTDVLSKSETTDVLNKSETADTEETSDIPSEAVITEAYEIIRKQKKRKKIILAVTAAFVVVALFCVIFNAVLSTPGFAKASSMKLTHEDDVFTLSWDTSKTGKAKEFIVEIYDGMRLEPVAKDILKNKDALLYSDDVRKGDNNSSSIAQINLPGGSIKGKKIIVYVNTEKKIKLFGKEIVRRGKSPMIAKVAIDKATDYGITTDVDLEDSSITFRTAKGSAEKYTLYMRADGAGLGSDTDAAPKNEFKLLSDARINGDSVEASISFGTNDFKLPEIGETYTFKVKGETISGPLTYIDMNYKPLTLDRNNFLTGSLAVNTSDDGNNRYTFTWNETKGEGYKIYLWNDIDQNWTEVATLGVNDERSYTTEKLKPCIDVKYMIEALEGPDSGGEGTQEVLIRTHPSVQYATVWPTVELPVYKDSIGDEQVGTVSLLHAMTVLDESDGRFHVRTGMGDNAEEGYIDATKCMVNLPDYMGDLCKYDITNSYSSIVAAHDYAIPDVSGTTIAGYGNVLLSDGTFLVPVLYPVAQNLARAGEKARDQGYKIKIYDAYRPGVASASLYELTSAALDYVVPDSSFKTVSLNDYMDGTRANVVSLSDLKNPKAEEEKKKSKKKKKDKEEKTTTEEKDYNTYSKVILGKDEYSLDDFLAQGGSVHSMGVALDVSLVRIENREELTMQSKVHDISPSSIQGKNNENANLLRDIMTNEGFTAAITEWWHFQDNTTRDELGAVAVSDGVSVEGWKKDDRGWRYRLADGNYYKDTTETIGVKTFTFDKDGYTDIK